VNWEAVGAIGELTSSIAIVVSLVYLAVQIRRGSRDSQRSTLFSIKSQMQQFRAMFAHDPEVARVFREGLADLGSLSTDDRWRFGALMQYEFSFFEDVFLLRGETSLFQYSSEDLRWLACRPGARAWWSKGRRVFQPDFQRHVDALVSEGDAGSGAGDSSPAA
jgi:hypothetical protein